MTTGIKEFANSIRLRREDAAARGWKMDLVILPTDAMWLILESAEKESPDKDEWFFVPPGRAYIAGVPILWSANRLPEGQAWFRYSSIKQEKVLVK